MKLSPLDFDMITTEMTTLFKAVGKDIMKVYNSDFIVEYKSDNSPVTKADIEEEEIILTHLKKITPDIPAYGEENFTTDMFVPTERFWLVDPIDGTRGFINKNNFFTINAGLVENG